jgi:uncharacterized protein (DUF1501 family)
MLTLFTGGSHQTCEGYTRRDMLQVGTLGLGGVTLANLLATKSAHASGGDTLVKDKAIVVLNLQGGPTHIETFDPKMTAPSSYRAMFGEVKTNLPGVTFGSHFPKLASMADRMAIVRSFRHGIGSHGRAAEHVMAGGNATGANMGSLYARVAGLTNPETGIPSTAVIVPKAVGEKYSKLSSNPSRITALGTLSSAYKPFDPSAGGEIVNNMKLRISQERLDDRKSLLAGLDSFKRQSEQSDLLAGADRFQQQAFDVIVGGISSAFDISKEDPANVARYDTAAFDIPKYLYKKKNKNLLNQSPIALGKQMLMARRLVQAGCRFVTVTSAGWDMHGNAFGVDDGMPLLGSAVDRAAGAFMEDLEELGMSDDVLLVITGEFGRTPRINKKGGRDHWGNLCTLAFAGGGLPMGQVIGRSDRTASVPNGDVVTSRMLLGTIMNVLFDTGKLRIQSAIPADIRTPMADSPTIKQLI